MQEETKREKIKISQTSFQKKRNKKKKDDSQAHRRLGVLFTLARGSDAVMPVLSLPMLDTFLSSCHFTE